MKSYIRFNGIPIFVFILFKVDTYKLIEIITEIDLVYLLISIILNIPQLFIKSFRWNLLLKKQGINYSFLHSFMVFLNSLYVGLITPGRIGEFIRVIYLKQDKGVSISKGFSSVLTDRLFDLYLLITLGFFGIWTFDIIGQLSNVFIIFSFIVIILPFFIINKTLMDHFVLLLFKFSVLKINKEKFKERYDSFYYGINELISSHLFISGLLTVLSYFFFFLQCYLISKSIDIKIGFGTLTLFMAISNLISFIPISISGLGTRDATLIFLFSIIGFNSELAVAYSFLVFITFHISGAFIGLISMWFYPLTNTINISDYKG